MTTNRIGMTFSFRCPQTLKDAFAAKAKANGTNPSALIKDFMQAYVDGGHDVSTDSSDTNEEQSTDSEKESTDSSDNNSEAFAEMANQIKSLQIQLAEVEDRLFDWGELLRDQGERWWALEAEVKYQLNFMEGVACPLSTPPPAKDEDEERNNTAPAGEVSEGNEMRSNSTDILAAFSLKQTDLAKRLGTTDSTLSTKRGKPNFSDWTAKRDPENIAWQYSPSLRKYKPVS